MPWVLGLDNVEGVYPWPVGNVMMKKCVGRGWCDALVFFVEAIRAGGKSNCRRVRYDGRFYIVHKERHVYFDGGLSAETLSHVSHVYGIDAESDKIHNRTLKGY
jgi:hypothetical protein